MLFKTEYFWDLVFLFRPLKSFNKEIFVQLIQTKVRCFNIQGDEPVLHYANCQKQQKDGKAVIAHALSDGKRLKENCSDFKTRRPGLQLQNRSLPAPSGYALRVLQSASWEQLAHCEKNYQLVQEGFVFDVAAALERGFRWRPPPRGHEPTGLRVIW